MARRYYNNTTATGTLSVAAGAGDLTFTTTGFTGYPTRPFTAIVDRGLATEEVVLVTDATGGSLTVTRGYDGTSGQSHGVGAVIEHVIAAEGPNKWDAHSEATSDTHGVTGALMGTTTAQTVTNKTNQISVYEAQGTTSPGAGPMFKARVDTTTRQGFTADTTGTAATGKGFTVEQSGVDRFRVNADGSTITNPSGSPTWAEDVTGNSRVTGNQTVTGTATVGAVSSGGAVSGTNVTASGTAQQLTSTTTGNATVAGTLGVTGTSTLGVVNSGAIAATGNITASGAFAGHTGAVVFSEQLEASAHGIWATKIRAKDTTVHNRSTRQPVVHNEVAAGLGVVVGSTLTLLDTFQWTQREAGNVSLVATVVGECAFGVHGNIAQSKLRWRLIRVSDSVQLAEQDFFYLSAQAGGGGDVSIATSTLVGAPDVLLTAGSAYKFEIRGIEDPAAYTLNMTIRDIFWLVTECVRAT